MLFQVSYHANLSKYSPSFVIKKTKSAVKSFYKP